MPLGEFTRARDALAARLRQAGQPDAAAAIKRLTKPTSPVWAINQTARQDAGAVQAFLDAVDRLRAVQDGRGSGDVGAATAAERAAFRRIMDGVRERLTAAGFRASPELLARVTATLRGAAADPARQEELTRGTLTVELQAPGFEALAGGAPPAEMVGRAENPVAQPPRNETAAERRDRERRERAREALRVAESDVASWECRAQALEAAVAERRHAVELAGHAVEELRARLTEAQRHLDQEEQAAEQAEREAERARRDVERATARRRAAEQALRRVRE